MVPRGYAQPQSPRLPRLFVLRCIPYQVLHIAIWRFFFSVQLLTYVPVYYQRLGWCNQEESLCGWIWFQAQRYCVRSIPINTKLDSSGKGLNVYQSWPPSLLSKSASPTMLTWPISMTHIFSSKNNAKAFERALRRREWQGIGFDSFLLDCSPRLDVVIGRKGRRRRCFLIRY